MAEIEQTKVCPLCAETIKAAAKICPHCRTWQKKWSFQNPQTAQSIGAIIWLVVIVGALMGLGYFFDHLIGPKRDFGQYQSQIKIVNSEVSFRMSGSNLMVSVVGVLTNQSDFGWKDVGLEAQLFNTNGKLIDVIQASDSTYNGVVVLPHAEAGFKIQTKATKNESEYATHKITVGTAKNIQAWP